MNDEENLYQEIDDVITEWATEHGLRITRGSFDTQMRRTFTEKDFVFIHPPREGEVEIETQNKIFTAPVADKELLRATLEHALKEAKL